MTNKNIEDDNFKIFSLMSNYLNNYSDYISKFDIEEIVSKDIEEEKAFARSFYGEGV